MQSVFNWIFAYTNSRSARYKALPLLGRSLHSTTVEPPLSVASKFQLDFAGTFPARKK